jgi:hypothetical protein
MRVCKLFQAFTVPRFVGLNCVHEVAPYDRIFDDLEIGLSTREAHVIVAQSPKRSFLVSPPDHSYVLDVSVGDIADTKWISLEFKLALEKIYNAGRLTVLIALASSIERTFWLDLRLIRGNDSFEDLNLGGVTPLPNTKMVTQNLSQPLDEFLGRFDTIPKAAKLLIFAPLEPDFSFSLAMLNALYSER